MKTASTSMGAKVAIAYPTSQEGVDHRRVQNLERVNLSSAPGSRSLRTLRPLRPGVRSLKPLISRFALETLSARTLEPLGAGSPLKPLDTLRSDT